MIQTAYHRNWARLPVDHKDASLAFYAPFWYPYSDVIGPTTMYSYDRNRHAITLGGTWDKTGRIIDGVDDQMTVPDTSSLDITGNLTIEAWLKWDSTQTDADGDILHRNRPYIFRALSTGIINLYYHDGIAWRSFVSLTALVNGVWTYVRVTRETSGANSDCVVYLNNTSDNSATLTGTAVTVAQTLRIGSLDGLSERYKGTIGEIRLYNRVVGVSEGARRFQTTRWRYQ